MLGIFSKKGMKWQAANSIVTRDANINTVNTVYQGQGTNFPTIFYIGENRSCQRNINNAQTVKSDFRF